MIERPPGGLPPRERQVLRRAWITFAVGIVLAAALTIVLVSLGVSASVTTAIVAPICFGTGIAVVFGVFKGHGAELRRQRRSQRRGDRVKGLVLTLILSPLLIFRVWTESGPSWGLGLTIFVGLCIVWALIDVWRAPPG